MPAETVGDPAGPEQPLPVWPDGFARAAEDCRAVLVLSALHGVTPRKLLALAAEHGTASAVLARIREGRAGSANDREFARVLDPETIAATAAGCGARVVPWGSTEYPSQLRHIHDPPAVLYVIGRPPPESSSAVAIVGARACTELGREIASEIGRMLALAGATVVSGAARGVDAAAHEGALGVRDGRTVAVMGCGVDVIYPPGSRRLIHRIRGSGTVVSEHAPGTQPFQRNFPARNRIVAGLCAATVVVEGAKGSGSMITAEHAMEFGREVFAVPGPVTSALAGVPLQLIRDGATMIRGPEDLLEDLGLRTEAGRLAERSELSDDERRVLDRLAGPTLPDRVAGALGAGVPEVVAVLMRLELRGLVRNVGGRFEPTLRGAASG
ncbi:MAG: DNA-processing protein DprA [Actinomycetota bacterium]